MIQTLVIDVGKFQLSDKIRIIRSFLGDLNVVEILQVTDRIVLELCNNVITSLNTFFSPHKKRQSNVKDTYCLLFYGLRNDQLLNGTHSIHDIKVEHVFTFQILLSV